MVRGIMTNRVGYAQLRLGDGVVQKVKKDQGRLSPSRPKKDQGRLSPSRPSNRRGSDTPVASAKNESPLSQSQTDMPFVVR